MFLINFLNRNITDDFKPLFEILYIIELCFLVTTLVLSIPIADAVARTSLHINIRLRIIFGILQACSTCTGRIIVIAHQYFGPSQYVEPFYLILFIYRASILALDRGIATVAWAWYESQAPTTLLFFAAQEALLISTAYFASFLLIYDYITDSTLILYYTFNLIMGSIAFIVVYRRNIREVMILKKGAVVNQYSVARTYQLNENIAYLKMLSRMVGPLIAATTPTYIFYPTYRFIPPGIGFDGLRYFSVDMFDLWLAITCVIVLICVPLFEPKISKKLRCMPNFLIKLIVRQEKNEISFNRNYKFDSDTYFDLLMKDLNRPIDVAHIA